MKAAVFREARVPFEVHDFPVSDPGPGMAVVCLECSGICGTDVHIYEGAIEFAGPIVLGHEFIGRVQDLGGGEHRDCLGRSLAVGDRVAVNVIEPCGRCLLCNEGGSASCLKLGESLVYTKSAMEPPHFHGGFAEVTMVPTRYLQKIPEAIPTNVAAAFLCAGPTVLRGLAYAGDVQPGQHVVVQGAGPVGLFGVLYAKWRGAASVTLIGSGSNPLRLELAGALGADTVFDIRTSSVDERREQVLQITGGVGADLAIEGTGNPVAVVEGISLLRPRGRYIWAGQYSDRGPVEFPTHVVTLNALQIFGSAQFTTADRESYFDFLSQIPDLWPNIERVITDRFTVDQVNEAMAKVCSGASIKAVFVEVP